METNEKQSTAVQPLNLKPSPPAGGEGTSVTKQDAMAIMVSALVMMRDAGWKLKLCNTMDGQIAYIVIDAAHWQLDGTLAEVEK